MTCSLVIEIKVNCLLLKLNANSEKCSGIEQTGIEPATFWSHVRRSNHWATRTQMPERRLRCARVRTCDIYVLLIQQSRYVCMYILSGPEITVGHRTISDQITVCLTKCSNGRKTFRLLITFIDSSTFNVFPFFSFFWNSLERSKFHNHRILPT